MTAACFFSAGGPWVAASARHSLRPLAYREGLLQPNSGASCRENASACRHPTDSTDLTMTLDQQLPVNRGRVSIPPASRCSASRSQWGRAGVLFQSAPRPRRAGGAHRPGGDQAPASTRLDDGKHHGARSHAAPVCQRPGIGDPAPAGLLSAERAACESKTVQSQFAAVGRGVIAGIRFGADLYRMPADADGRDRTPVIPRCRA